MRSFAEHLAEQKICVVLVRVNRFLHLPQIAGADEIARRITPRQAQDNLSVLEQTQRLLYTNVQEALALEVGLLKLQL